MKLGRPAILAIVAGVTGAAAFAAYKLTGGGATAPSTSKVGTPTASAPGASAGGSSGLCQGPALTPGATAVSLSLSSAGKNVSVCSPNTPFVRLQPNGATTIVATTLGTQVTFQAGFGATVGDKAVFAVVWENADTTDSTAMVTVTVVA